MGGQYAETCAYQYLAYSGEYVTVIKSAGFGCLPSTIRVSPDCVMLRMRQQDQVQIYTWLQILPLVCTTQSLNVSMLKTPD